MEVTSEDQQVPLGLTLSYLKNFVDIHGGRDALRGVTTEEVCSKLLIPYTASTKLSLVDHVRQQPEGHLYVKPAQWFVSHAWSYNFLDVIDALDDFFQDDSMSVWLCTFCNNQHEVGGKVHSFDHWFGIFRNALRAIGKVVMVMSPWNNPTTLTRTWCVFEVYAAVVENAQFEIALDKSQKALFLEDIQGEEAFTKMLATVKSENSETSVATDRDYIFQLIREEVGFVELDRMVFGAIEKWMQRMVDQQIDDAATSLIKADWMMIKGRFLDDKGEFIEADSLFLQCCDIYLQEKGEFHPSTLNALSHSTAMKVLEGRPFEEVVPKLVNILEHQIDLLTKNHYDTLVTMQILGQCYFRHGKYDLALPMLMDCYERRVELLGEENQLTRDSMALIGMIYGQQNKLDESIEWCVRGYDIQRRVMGEDHPETNGMRSNLSVAYILAGNYPIASQLLLECYESYRRTLGPQHTSTLAIQANLANAYRLLGRFAEAERLLLDCLAFESTDKFTNPSSRRYLGLTYMSTGEYELANKHYSEALEMLEGVVGRTHDVYARSLMPMYLLKLKTNSFEDLDDIEAFESVLRDTQWTQDLWKYAICHGCRIEIRGVLCPVRVRRNQNRFATMDLT
ncbi:unnamed protein product [Aphanomyces euteiches]